MKTSYTEPLSNGTILQGKYQIVSNTVNAGGFGRIYKARNNNDGTQMAIKEFCLNEEYYEKRYFSEMTPYTMAQEENMQQKLRSFFDREVKLLSILNGIPGIRIPIIEGGVFDEYGRSFYAMNFIEGQTITETVDTDGVMSEEEAIRYIVQVGKVLHNAHEVGLIHCDVSPNNIIVTKNGAVLVDFGNAKAYDEEASRKKIQDRNPIVVDTDYLAAMETKDRTSVLGFERVSTRIGTMGFIAPDTIFGTVQGDVFSLAATMFFALTGEKPSWNPDRSQKDLEDKCVGKKTIEALMNALNMYTKDIAAFINELPSEEVIRSLLSY